MTTPRDCGRLNCACLIAVLKHVAGVNPALQRFGTRIVTASGHGTAGVGWRVGRASYDPRTMVQSRSAFQLLSGDLTVYSAGRPLHGDVEARTGSDRRPGMTTLSVPLSAYRAIENCNNV